MAFFGRLGPVRRRHAQQHPAAPGTCSHTPARPRTRRHHTFCIRSRSTGTGRSRGRPPKLPPASRDIRSLLPSEAPAPGPATAQPATSEPIVIDDDDEEPQAGQWLVNVRKDQGYSIYVHVRWVLSGKHCSTGSVLGVIRLPRLPVRNCIKPQNEKKHCLAGGSLTRVGGLCGWRVRARPSARPARRKRPARLKCPLPLQKTHRCAAHAEDGVGHHAGLVVATGGIWKEGRSGGRSWVGWGEGGRSAEQEGGKRRRRSAARWG
jgi:hypothetical protein